MLETVAVESTFHALCAYTSLDCCLLPLMHHFSSSWLKVIKGQSWQSNRGNLGVSKKSKCEFQDCYAGSRIQSFDPSSSVPSFFVHSFCRWRSKLCGWPSHHSLTPPSFSHLPWKGRQTCQLWSRRCLRARMMLVLLVEKKFIDESRIRGDRRPSWRPNLSTKQASPISRNSSVSIWTRFRNPNSSVTAYIYGGSIFRSTFILLKSKLCNGRHGWPGVGNRSFKNICSIVKYSHSI